tara:strand:+ start:343 stop:516 length:174 start_codon:yes stop_codon:yes gene_type:complete
MFEKSKKLRLYILELTVFVKVKIANLKDFSKSIPVTVNKEETKKSVKTKISIERKYL